MMKFDKGQIELKEYPIHLTMPYGVSSGIKARRCQKCNLIFFTNDDDFTRCRSCKN